MYTLDTPKPFHRLIAAIVLAAGALFVVACAKKEEAPPPPPPPPVVFSLADVDIEPQFPGGSVGLTAYLKENIDYSHRTEQDNLEGVVQIGFVVGADGKVSDVDLLQGLHPRLDAMALEAVKKMPAWTPGLEDAKPVSVKLELPVVFNILEEE